MDPGLDDIVARAIATARTAWPGVVLADDAFAAHVAARLPADVPPRDALAALCLPDLWLACAIAAGDPAALRAFEALLADLEPALAHLGGGSALVEDVRHAVRTRVLGPDDARIAAYRGRGDLRGWLRVVAVREGLQLVRARRREAPLSSDPDDALAERLDVAPSVTLTPDERRIVRDGFATALATLTPRERNLLRQHYLYGATIDELGVVYGVHRATAARWLARVRELVLRRTRRQVGEALGVTGVELDSVMGRIAGHLDYSLRHTLSLES